MSVRRRCLSALFVLLLAPFVGAAQMPPRPDHIVLLILENHHYTQVADVPEAPYIASLMNDSMTALFTRSHALGHPSQPNYIRLFAGTAQGVADDNVPTGIPYKTRNLAASLIDAGYSFVTYSEDLPYVGFDSARYGGYARRHNPVMNWIGTDTNQVPATTSRPLTDFPDSAHFDDLPTICFVVPNQDNDMHNGADPERITRADTWTRDHLAGYVRWCRSHNSLLIVTFDEDDDKHDNRILTFFLGPMVEHGSYADSISHYSVLRMMEEMYALPYAGHTATSVQVPYCWKATADAPTTADRAHGLAALPVPARDMLSVEVATDVVGGTVELVTLEGTAVRAIAAADARETMDLRGLPGGVYLLRARKAGIVRTCAVMLAR